VNGYQMFVAVSVVCWPVMAMGVIAARRKVILWQRLEKIHFGKLEAPVVTEPVRPKRRKKGAAEQSPDDGQLIMLTFPGGKSELVAVEPVKRAVGA
jgi:hypothetical protein